MGRTGKLKKLPVYIILLSVLIFALFSPKHDKRTNIHNVPQIHSSYDHPKIHFDHNADLDSFPNKTGIGTVENPYVICDLEIDAKSIGNPMILINIDRHLILKNLTIRNSQIEGSNNYFGIEIEDCSNIDVVESNFFNNSWGVALYDSTNCTISQNYFSGNDIGVIGFYCRNIIVSYNLCINNDAGLHPSAAITTNYWYNNTIIDNRYGICLDGGAQYAEVKKNYIKGCNVGIRAHDFPQFAFDDYILIEENILHGNLIGLELAQTDKNTIRRNVISNNTLGIRLEESSDNKFSRNKFLNNDNDVLEIDSHGNGLIVPLGWQMIVVWSIAGVFGINCIVLSLIYIPKRIKRVKTNKTLERGELLRSEEKYEEAFQMYDSILEKDPSFEPALNKKIALLYELKRYNEISEILKGKIPKKEESI